MHWHTPGLLWREENWALRNGGWSPACCSSVTETDRQHGTRQRVFNEDQILCSGSKLQENCSSLFHLNFLICTMGCAGLPVTLKREHPSSWFSIGHIMPNASVYCSAKGGHLTLIRLPLTPMSDSIPAHMNTFMFSLWRVSEQRKNSHWQSTVKINSFMLETTNRTSYGDRNFCRAQNVTSATEEQNT